MYTCFAAAFILAMSFAAPAQSGHASVPESVSLKQAKLSPSFKKKVLRDLGASDLDVADRQIALTNSTVKLVHLGRSLHYVLRVDGGGEICGATGNCPVLFYFALNHRLLLSTGGFDVHVLRSSHHGAYDLVARTNLSCCEGTLEVYDFDGSMYRRVRESSETY